MRHRGPPILIKSMGCLYCIVACRQSSLSAVYAAAAPLSPVKQARLHVQDEHRMQRVEEAAPAQPTPAVQPPKGACRQRNNDSKPPKR